MSHSYATYTFTADTKSIIPSFSSLEEFEAFQDSSFEAIRGSKTLHRVFGNTRSGWAIYTTKNLLKNSNFPAIQFLTDVGHQYNFESEFGNVSNISIINPPQQAQVISELEQLISSLIKNPDAAYDAEEFGIYCEGDVEAALARDYVSSNPAFDPQVRGDEGQSADYLFVFLRSILELMKNAKSEGLNVVHVLQY